MKAIRAEELLDRKISRFDGVKAINRSSDYSLREYLGEVRGTKHENAVAKIRNESCVEKQKVLKTKLPCVTLSGVGDRKAKATATEPHFDHSGLLQMDFDLSENPNLETKPTIQQLKNDQYVLAFFLSPRCGIKAIVPIHQSVGQHKDSFEVASSYFRETYGLVADEAPKNHRSLCFLSHDPHAFLREGLVLMFAPNASLQVQGNTVTQTHSNSVTQILRNSEECNSGSVIERVKRAKEIKDKVEKWIHDPTTPPQLVKLWELYVNRRFTPNLNERNKVLCEFIPFAHRRLSRECTMELATVMRQVWDCVCTDPLHQHIREAESLWAGCENTFMSELNEYELELYHLFDGSMEYLRSPFRICRDLAFYDEGKTDIGKFFLGCRDLGIRLGINHKTASKYLLELVNYKIIKVVSAGRMIKRQASEYEWMLSS